TSSSNFDGFDRRCAGHSPAQQTPPPQWEGALDVKPLMTEEDLEVLNEAKFGAKASKIKEESAYKKVARRYE
ncbi:hypothetical protein ScalyP_jg338, partial [Parmales sp. scaly parma]